MLVMTESALMVGLLCMIASTVVALWVTRGDRKWTTEGESAAAGAFATGYIIAIIYIFIDIICTAM